MSITTVRGFLVSEGTLEEHLGSCSEELFEKVVGEQSELLDECQKRIDRTYFEDREPLSAIEALHACIQGNLLDEQVLEAACVFEALAVVIAEPLEDRSESNTLWQNSYFWLEDFATVFEMLGFESLREHWNRFSLPLSPRGVYPEWPIWSLISPLQLSIIKRELEGVDLERALETIPADILDRKESGETLEELQFIMSENLLTIDSWVTKCRESSASLLILFDGDPESGI